MTADPAQRHSRSFAFGPFVLIPERQLLLKGEAPVRIGSRALDILTALVERPGQLVSKHELLSCVWPNTIVEEGNLKVNMTALRRALGERTGAAQYIATVVGRGYRFVAPVQSFESVGPSFDAGVASTHPHNLPTGTTRIVGRADVIDAIRQELKEARLVSIVGPGGIGKTTVALAVAEHAIGLCRDGVWLVDLAPLKDPSLVPNAIATAIGLAAHSASMLAALCGFLRDREMLLLLDSCEHIIDAVAACADRILADAAGVRILATSREPLRVKGERVRRLPGLGTPSASSGLNAEEALAFPAIQLFVDRASDWFESFSLSDADAPMAAEICRRLDGLALAIELAATRVEAFGVGGLLDQLDSRFHLLEGHRAGPERHRTLTATIDWSYDLLSESERAVVRRLSVFAGAFSLESACAVAADEGIDRVRVVQDLANLVSKSLVAAGARNIEVEYRQLDMMRAYCLERLLLSGEDQAVRCRHAEHVCAVLEQAASEWSQRPAREWSAAYGHVVDDLRVALAWAGRDEANRPLRIRLTVAGLLLWNHFSLIEECHVHVSRAVEELDAAGLTGTAFEMKFKLWLGGSTMITRGLKPQAMDALRRASQIANQIGDTDYRHRCLMLIAAYELFTGEYNAGMRTIETFASVAAADDPSILPEGEVHLGIAELFLGRLQNAQRRLESLQQRDMRYFNGSYSVRYMADIDVLLECALSQVLWLRGFPDSAARTAAAAFERARPAHHHLSLNNALTYSCPVFYWSGRYDQCGRYVELLAEHVTRQGLITRRPIASFYRAALAYTQGSASSGTIDGLKQAIEEFRNVNYLVRMPYYLSVLADALVHRGRLGEAETTIRTALDIARAQNEGWCLPEVMRIQASILTAQGQTGEAEAILLESMALAQEIGALSWRLRAASDLAQLWRAQARARGAREVLLPIYSEFTEGFETRDLVVAADLLASLASPEDGEAA